MTDSSNSSSESPGQDQRDQFVAAIESGDISAASELLAAAPILANADLRDQAHRDEFTNGHPLFRACRNNNNELADLLLASNSDQNATGSVADDRPEHGMPLHFAATEHRNYALAHRLLYAGATPNSYPNCDKSTVECMFYQAREEGMSTDVARRSYATYLPNDAGAKAKSVTEMIGPNVGEATKLFARMVDLGGQPPFTAIVRDQNDAFEELLLEIVAHATD